MNLPLTLLLLAILAMQRVALAQPAPCSATEGMILANAVDARLQAMFHVAAGSPHLYIVEDASDLRHKLNLAPDSRAAGLYLSKEDAIHVACHEGTVRIFETVLRHETTHHYLQQVFGTLPRWLDEGIASYMETGTLEDGPPATHIHVERLLEFRTLLKHNQVPSLTDLFQQQSRFASPGYAVSWALIYAMLHHPDPDIQNRRRQALHRLLGTVGQDPDTAYRAFFATLAAEKMDIPHWEANWHREIWQLPL